MSSPEKSFFTILEQVNESHLKIKENIPESVEEWIEIAGTHPAENQDGKPAIMFITTQGRQFARLEEWPRNRLLEIPESLKI